MKKWKKYIDMFEKRFEIDKFIKNYAKQEVQCQNGK